MLITLFLYYLRFFVNNSFEKAKIAKNFFTRLHNLIVCPRILTVCDMRIVPRQM